MEHKLNTKSESSEIYSLLCREIERERESYAYPKKMLVISETKGKAFAFYFKPMLQGH